ncbi:MAG: NAD(P)-binding domain-containing protein, partial [Deltaproteobacteria bacterium]|nr:NAD(P)-binding domain-containing protein [Deltaproteobacteria bacterium]
GLLAHQKGLSYAVLEQGEFGGAIRHYPRQKVVMTSPMDLPGYHAVRLSTPRKEELVALLEDVVATTGLRVSTNERVDAVTSLPTGGFQVTSSQRELRAARVLLTVGRRGTPRTLGVPGEEQEKVAYRLLDPELFQHSHILVVGGGDSALEAACDLGAQSGNRVSLSYRGAAFSRPKAANLQRLEEARDADRVTVYLESRVQQIEVDRVVLDHRGEEVVLPNDQVFVFAGGILPTAFLEKAGIKVLTHFGKRVVEKPSAS